MKKYQLLPLLILLPFITSFTSGSGDNIIMLGEFHFYPLRVNNSNRLIFNIASQSFFPRKVDVSLAISNRTYYQHTLASATLEVSLAQRDTFDVVVDAWVANTGLNYFVLSATSGTSKKSLSFALGANYRSEVHLPGSSLLFDSYQGVDYLNDILTIKNYLMDDASFLAVTEYQDDLYLDLNRFTSSYSGGELIYRGARLVFSQMNSLFPRLPLNGQGEPYLELLIEKNGNNLAYRLRDPLYVDDETHIISLTKEVGYRLTDTIYFPKYRLEDLEYFPITLEIDEFSMIKTNIKYIFTLLFEREFIASNGTYQIDYEWK